MMGWENVTANYRLVRDLESKIKELEISLEHVLDRLYKLEEKERQRVYIERDEHEQDVSE